MLESFAEKLAEVFIQGELFISDWSPERDAKIKVAQVILFFPWNDRFFFFLSFQFTLGPASKNPMHIPLIEMTSEEAAKHATKVFLDVSVFFKDGSLNWTEFVRIC